MQNHYTRPTQDAQDFHVPNHNKRMAKNKSIEASYLQNPRTVAGKRVARMYDVPMASKTAQQIAHALYQRIVLRMDENLGDQILAGILDQTFAYHLNLNTKTNRLDEKRFLNSLKRFF